MVHASYTPQTNTSPKKRDHFSREHIFQSLISRGHVRFQGSGILIQQVELDRTEPRAIDPLSDFLNASPKWGEKTEFY